MQQLNSRNVSVIAQTGSQFDLSTAKGKMIAGVLAVLSQFERDLIGQAPPIWIGCGEARGKRLGRQKGQNPSDKYAENALKLIDEGRSYRWISHELQIEKKTVTAIVKRSKVG